MLIVYASRTGNTKRFVTKTGLPSQSIDDVRSPSEPFVLVTYTDGAGEVPERVRRFLRAHSRVLRGVAASGNRNFGSDFGRAANTIAAEYGVPIVHRFELSGASSDVEKFKKGVEEIERTCAA
ncbi:class Ib ribonucleoside-diphosphate reductase assembly flavoprotein NrdI [Paenibacillus sp. 1P03SA]|uniref:class Ib ribonucleoside-diphosphate reductase assembly flavoprotein NrdI n=1 Tax=Paenibacillus sp. 1P03SA TaxID=3132294 RepID=UPI0039A05766